MARDVVYRSRALHAGRFIGSVVYSKSVVRHTAQGLRTGAELNLIIDRYLLREILFTWLAVTVVLLVILISNRLVGFLADAAAGRIAGGVIFTLLGLKAVSALVMLLPLSLFLAISFSLGRLHKDSEMAALSACGAGPARLYRPLFMVAVPLALGLGWLSFLGAPWAADVGYQLRDKAMKTAELSSLAAGRFKEVDKGARVFFIERLSEDRSHIENVFVQMRRADRLQLQSASSARQYIDPDSGEQVVVMDNGYLYEGLPGRADFRIVHFARQTLRLPAEDGRDAPRKRDASPTLALLESTDRGDIAELHWRLAAPVSMLVLTLLALPLSYAAPREGRYGRLLAAILVYIIYANLLGTANVWLDRGSLPVTWGMWWVHGLLLMLALVLLARRLRLPGARRKANAAAVTA